jgi:hypothetical protein
MLKARMRTTIDLEDDLVLAAKELAKQRKCTIGRVVSDMCRRGLEFGAPRVRNGVPLFTPKAGVARPSMALVSRLRD